MVDGPHCRSGGVLLQWGSYHFVMWARPSLVLTLSGSDSWPEVHHWWLTGTVVLKVFVFVLALPCLWLTPCARQLRKGRRA